MVMGQQPALHLRRPHARRLPVERYYTPEEFDTLRRRGEEMGFLRVESGPLVRSSYMADLVEEQAGA